MMLQLLLLSLSPPEDIKDTLGEVLANKGMHQLRIAETEKICSCNLLFQWRVEEPNKMKNVF